MTISSAQHLMVVLTSLLILLLGGCRVPQLKQYHSTADINQLQTSVFTDMDAVVCDAGSQTAGVGIIAAVDSTDDGRKTPYILVTTSGFQRATGNIGSMSVDFGAVLSVADARSMSEGLKKIIPTWGKEPGVQKGNFWEWHSYSGSMKNQVGSTN